VVSICGGEPLLYPEIGELVRQTMARGRTIYLCTNAMFLPKKLKEFKPDPRFFINVHLDGLEETTTCASSGRAFSSWPSRPSSGQGGGLQGLHQYHIYNRRHGRDLAAVRVPEQFDMDGHIAVAGYGYSAVNDGKSF